MTVSPTPPQDDVKSMVYYGCAVAAIMVVALFGCRASEQPLPDSAPPPERQFTLAEQQACLDYYSRLPRRKRNAFCNPAHDLGFFVDGTNQATGNPISSVRDQP